MPWLPTPVLLYFTYQTGAPTTERSKVATVISLLDELGVYERFMGLFRADFNHPPEGREGGEQLFNSSRVPRLLRSTPSPFGLWQTPVGGMSWCSPLYSAVDCARRSRRSWHVEMTTYPWTLSS